MKNIFYCTMLTVLLSNAYGDGTYNTNSFETNENRQLKTNSHLKKIRQITPVRKPTQATETRYLLDKKPNLNNVQRIIAQTRRKSSPRPEQGPQYGQMYPSNQSAQYSQYGQTYPDRQLPPQIPNLDKRTQAFNLHSTLSIGKCT